MPLYEYVCQNCELTQELLLQGDQQAVCESCGSSRLTKLLSLAAAHSTSPSSSSAPKAPPAGSCGSGCGCFPNG